MPTIRPVFPRVPVSTPTSSASVAPSASPATGAPVASTAAAVEDAFTTGMSPRPTPPVRTDVYLGSGDDHYLPSGMTGAIAGKPLVVNYLRNRSSIGADDEVLSTLTFHSRIDGVAQPPQQVTCDPARTDAYGSKFALDIPAGAKGEVEYWFEATTHSGKTLWDSKGGANFKLDIVPSGGPTVRFDDLWGEAVSGPIRAGGSFQLAYDVDRLRQFIGDGWYRVGNTLHIAAYVSFDDKPAHKYSITSWDKDHNLHVTQPTVEVPADAREVRIWFQGTTVGPRMYDSNYNADYRFPIEP